MRQVEFAPLGRKVSRLGLGCARLDGRVGWRRAAALLETALDLGVTYFDVAAAYGTAEEALGKVLGASPDVVVATKVGPPRPPYNAMKMRLRSAAKAVIDRSRWVKGLLRGPGVAPPRDPTTRPRYDFSQSAIERSLETSLQNLRRDRIDLFLAHEPNRLDLTDEVAAGFQTLVDRSLISAFGVGVDVREDRWAPFGSVWQSGWPGEQIESYGREASYSFHGVLRYEPRDRYGRFAKPPGELIRNAMLARPDAVLLISASTPERLRELILSVEEADADR